MSTAAFLMVSFVGVPYTEVLIAATIPALLYFLGIFLQIDGYAAQQGLSGTPRDMLPRLGASLLAGWPYLGALALLTVLLFTSGSESQVPYWVVGVLLAIAVITPGLRFGPQEWLTMVLDVGRTLGQIIAIIAGVGLFLGGLSATGVALSLFRDLVAEAGFGEVALALLASLVAVYAIACAIEGWLVGIEAPVSGPLRVLLGAGGFLLFLSSSALALVGLAVVGAVLGLAMWGRRPGDSAG
ncbi:TRAP transporter large permease subunit [Nesterenkonia suensis]